MEDVFFNQPEEVSLKQTQQIFTINNYTKI